MFDFNGENLKVGDKVIVYQSHFSSKAYYVGTVVKRTPTGLLDIEWGNGRKERFKSNGYEYHRSSLMEVSTQEYLDSVELTM